LKNTLKTKREGITKEQHITQSAFIGRNWVGLLKNTKTKHKKGITKSSTSLNPCFHRWELGRTVENTLKTKHKERNHKEQHITQSLLS
jgi:hypothetical protein